MDLLADDITTILSLITAILGFVVAIVPFFKKPKKIANAIGFFKKARCGKKGAELFYQSQPKSSDRSNLIILGSH